VVSPWQQIVRLPVCVCVRVCWCVVCARKCRITTSSAGNVFYGDPQVTTFLQLTPHFFSKEVWCAPHHTFPQITTPLFFEKKCDVVQKVWCELGEQKVCCDETKCGVNWGKIVSLVGHRSFCPITDTFVDSYPVTLPPPKKKIETSSETRIYIFYI